MDNINTSEILMKLVETTAEIRQSVGDISRRLDEHAMNTNAQLAGQQERLGKAEVTLGVHENRLKSLETRVNDADEDREALERRVDDVRLRLYVLIAFLSAGGGMLGGLIGKLLGL